VPDTRSLDPLVPGLSPSPLGVGLVGLGRWGRNYVKTLLALPECRLVAAADANPDARDSHRSSFIVYRSLEELLSDPAVEALVIATPDRTHFSLADAALKAGRDVLVEKPMALDAPEAEALAEQAEAGGRVLAVGHTAVYHPDFESLKVRLNDLPPDPARQLSAVRTSSGPSANGQSPPVDPRMLYDLCPHDLAMAVLLLGTPVAARARCRRDGVEYEVRFEGDALLSGQAEWRTPPHTRRFEVAGAGSIAELSAPPLDARDSPLGRQCVDFIECCRTRRQPLSNGRLGVAVTRCLAALTASSADSNAWVPLPGLLHHSSFILHPSEVA
jgi:predicted dehydrogenase